jgi:hypothetical protein
MQILELEPIALEFFGDGPYQSLVCHNQLVSCFRSQLFQIRDFHGIGRGVGLHFTDAGFGVIEETEEFGVLDVAGHGVFGSWLFGVLHGWKGGLTSGVGRHGHRSSMVDSLELGVRARGCVCVLKRFETAELERGGPL